MRWRESERCGLEKMYGKRYNIIYIHIHIIIYTYIVLSGLNKYFYIMYVKKINEIHIHI